MIKLKANDPMMKECAQYENYFEYWKNGQGSNISELALVNVFLFYLQGTQNWNNGQQKKPR